MTQCVVDTVILVRANGVPDAETPARVSLLGRIASGGLVGMVSDQLAQEYKQKIKPPLNDFVRAFFELALSPDGTKVVANWHRAKHGDFARMRACRYPYHDRHALWTAYRPNQKATIATEEGPMLLTDACIYHAFHVHVRRPSEV